MDKSKFLASFKPKSSSHKLPDGEEITIHELTLEQRGKLMAAAKKDAMSAQALVVCMGCELFTEADLKDVCKMSGEIVTQIADAILDVSGLSEGDARKNS